MKPLLAACATGCLVLLAAFSAFATQSVGKIISMQPGVEVTREGAMKPLAVTEDIFVADVIITDSQGKVQVLFNDDTSLSLGPETRVAVTDYVDSGLESSFQADLLQGLMRAITGRLVAQNPEGFQITAPAATVGIRGTILSLSSEAGSTTVYVENSLHNKVFVNGIPVQQAYKLTVSGESAQPRAITPEDEVRIAKSTSPMPDVHAAPATASEAERMATAMVLLEKGNQADSTRAFEIFSALLRENPQNHDINLGLARSAFAAGKLNQAVMAYERLLPYHSADKEILTGLGQAYLALGDASTANRFLLRAAKL